MQWTSWLTRPSGQEPEHWVRSHLARQFLYHKKGGDIGPLQVVESEQQRGSSGPFLEPRTQLLQPPEPNIDDPAWRGRHRLVGHPEQQALRHQLVELNRTGDRGRDPPV